MANLVNRKRFTNSVDKNLLSEIRKLSDDTRIPLSKLLDEAIADLLKKYDKNPELKG